MLTGVVSLILPNREQTGLLASCLGGPSAFERWSRWSAGRADPLEDAAALGARTLLPLVDWSLGEARALLPQPVRARLTACRLAERARFESYERITADLASALAGRRVLLVKGAPLAQLCYPERELRHCHDIDIVAHPDDEGDVVSRLVHLGLVRGRGIFVHESGLPVRVHRGFFASRAYHLSFASVYDRRMTMTVARAPLESPCPADALVQLCGHASYWHGPESLRWVPDAVFLARLPGMDWDRVLWSANAARVAVPLSVQLAYLQRSFEAPIPGVVVQTLRASAARGPWTRTAVAAWHALRAQPRRILTRRPFVRLDERFTLGRQRR